MISSMPKLELVLKGVKRSQGKEERNKPTTNHLGATAYAVEGLAGASTRHRRSDVVGVITVFLWVLEVGGGDSSIRHCL